MRRAIDIDARAPGNGTQDPVMRKSPCPVLVVHQGREKTEGRSE